MEEPIADPAAMTPSQRRREIAAILARGVLRLRLAGQTCPGSRSPGAPEKASEFGQDGLDQGCQTSPHVLVR